MAAQQISLYLLCIIFGCLAEPGRVPKVYNALITSNQNLEPSKAYPVYQPVIHDTAFSFPFHPAVFYGDYPLTNGLLPPQHVPPKVPIAPSTPAPEPPTEKPSEAPEPEETKTEIAEKSTQAPPPPTESPIPLNEFGLPPQVLPLGRIDPAYSGFTHLGPFTYTYPSFRFYDPYDPFVYNPYGNFPIYRPLTNVLGQGVPIPVGKPEVPTSTPSSTDGQTPPPEPNDLNVLNYASKDPAIPNVPPPPLPQGGLKSDKDES